MPTLDELFAQGAKEVYQDIWTTSTNEVPEEERHDGREYHFDLAVTRGDAGYSIGYHYLGSREKEVSK